MRLSRLGDILGVCRFLSAQIGLTNLQAHKVIAMVALHSLDFVHIRANCAEMFEDQVRCLFGHGLRCSN